MTKADFLSGQFFHLAGEPYRRFRFIENEPGDQYPGYIVIFKGPGWQGAEHHANVKQWTSDLVVVCAWVLGKPAETIRRLADFEVIK